MVCRVFAFLLFCACATCLVCFVVQLVPQLALVCCVFFFAAFCWRVVSMFLCVFVSFLFCLFVVGLHARTAGQNNARQRVFICACCGLLGLQLLVALCCFVFFCSCDFVLFCVCW